MANNEETGITLGKAYVQIIPSAKGIKSGIEDVLGDGEDAGQSFGQKLVGGIKKAIAAIGIGKILKEAISQGSELEQNLGGTEAVFNQFASNIQEVAKDAYKNMGMSASEYMASANKMASLLQGGGMDTEKAMNLVTSSMQRAADVASVMGISTESAMEAINGAAKGNFTMMDNLGVAMNATTLEAYAMSKGITKAYSNMSNTEKTELAMQMFMERTQNMAGNFARESAETISGSMGAVKASINDFLGNLATGQEINSSLNALVTTTVNFGVNIGQAVINIFKAIPQTVVTLIREVTTTISSRWEDVTSTLTTTLKETLPAYLETTLEMIKEVAQEMVNNLPTMIDAVGNLLTNMLSFILENMPEFLSKGFEIVQSMTQGLLDNLPTIIHSMGELLRNLLTTILNNLPSFLQSGIKIIGELAKGLIDSIPQIIKSTFQIVKEIWNTFANYDWWTLGKNILEGIKNGILGAISSVVNAAKRAASSIWNGITGFLGIHSPSRKGIWAGQMLDKGLAIGIDKNTGIVTRAVDGLNDELMPSVQRDVVQAMSYDVTATRSSFERSQPITSSSDRLVDLIENGKLVLMLDSGEIVGALSEKIDGVLGQLQLRRARG